ncbi:phosphoribosyltransferase [Spongiivirga citrea]|uniref:Phosphoribosyltransferase n=1 Tax=Spongiivirga citrea TaxID=1481457 RepID=A0A6M0CP82_9FLAO|nr:phosphoribosyltransferase family protein [Spongiivirga citrea]NER15740.1 phosphoribosyltransferase [Spongiivirga citrea]
MYKNRTDAGKQLALRLLHYKNEDVVVLAVPRGGLPLGKVVAKTLQAPLDVVLTKKIGHPYNKEYAIGAVSLTGHILNQTIGVSEDYIIEEIKRIRETLSHRHNQYYKNLKPQLLKNKTVIIVDDGVATGSTLLATVKLVSEREPDNIVVAIPVASKSAMDRLNESDYIHEILCLQIPSNFRAVGQSYDDFSSVSDHQAISILENSNKKIAN